MLDFFDVGMRLVKLNIKCYSFFIWFVVRGVMVLWGYWFGRM